MQESTKNALIIGGILTSIIIICNHKPIIKFLKSKLDLRPKTEIKCPAGMLEGLFVEEEH